MKPSLVLAKRLNVKGTVLPRDAAVQQAIQAARRRERRMPHPAMNPPSTPSRLPVT